MEDSTKNLCALIPTSLHNKIRERQESAGQTLSQYMTWLITTFYETEGKMNMVNSSDTRTVAFQVPADLFEQFKEYLKRNNIKQYAFFQDCMKKALENGPTVE